MKQIGSSVNYGGKENTTAVPAFSMHKSSEVQIDSFDNRNIKFCKMSNKTLASFIHWVIYILDSFVCQKKKCVYVHKYVGHKVYLHYNKNSK